MVCLYVGGVQPEYCYQTAGPTTGGLISGAGLITGILRYIDGMTAVTYLAVWSMFLGGPSLKNESVWQCTTD